MRVWELFCARRGGNVCFGRESQIFFLFFGLGGVRFAIELRGKYNGFRCCRRPKKGGQEGFCNGLLSGSSPTFLAERRSRLLRRCSLANGGRDELDTILDCKVRS